MIDIYCERLGPGLLAEPFNAFSNIAFFISAWFIWKTGHKLNQLPYLVWSLIILILTVGVGSFLFHTFATNWARLLDIIPILLFQFVFFWVYLRQVIKLNFLTSISLVILYVLFALFCRQFPDVLNGSFFYAPAFLLLLVLGLYHYLQNKQERFLILGAFVIFTISLTIRTLDPLVCNYVPIGIHFLWHLFSAFLVYLLARAIILNLPQPHISSNEMLE